MREARLAEWILSLVTAQERAASTVGDLLEERLTRGRFWFEVLRTAGVSFCRDLFSHPFTTLVLAVSAWAAQVCSGYLLYTGPYLVLPIRPDEWTARITRILLCTLAPMLIGWVVGKCSKGREVATSLVAAAVLPYGIPSYPQISAFGEFSVLVTFTLAGAILCRFNAREPSRSGASHG